jgi:hypothetical protein
VCAACSDVSRIKEFAGWLNVYYEEVEPSLAAMYTDASKLGWFYAFHVKKGRKGTTIAGHISAAHKVLDMLDAEVLAYSTALTVV